ncbi:MAG: hypothetical protein ACLQU4_18915 [Limisphaerales bacterium]
MQVVDILALTGHAILLPIPRGTKRPTDTGWQTFGEAQMRDPEYLARLNNGSNVGMNGRDKEINDIRAIVHSGQLGKCTEDQLKRMLVVIDHYDASNYPHMTQGLREPVQNQLERVQRERHFKDSTAEITRLHKEALEEQARLHRIQIANDRQLADDAALDNDKKHGQSLAISKEANQLSKRAILIAWLSVLATVVIGVIGVIVAHLDSSRTSTSDTNAPRIKETAPQLTMPQIVPPMPKPTPTNSIQTNAAQKK